MVNGAFLPRERGVPNAFGTPPSGGRNQRNSTFADNLLTLFREFCL
jgi:hypothetical protein